MLKRYEPFLTERGRAALAGDASAFEHDVEIEVGTGVEDLTRQAGERALGELQTAEKRAAGAVVTDVEEAQTGFVRKAERDVETALITAEEDAKVAARSAEQDLLI